MVNLTSEKLKEAGLEPMSIGEMLKFLGVIILITGCEFQGRSDLWSLDPPSKYLPAYAFGEKTGMSRNRFDALFRYVTWSFQPKERPEEMSSEDYRWMMVDDHVDLFNAHCKEYCSPLWKICVDKSMSKWNGLGGTWFNIGLPNFITMDRKPEDGAEIQNAADGCTRLQWASLYN